MSMSLDNYFGIHAKALSLRDKRSAMLAQNLANVDTPNYKAKDIDFKENLQQAMGGEGTMVKTNEGHMSMNDSLLASMKYRQPTHVSLDGNTVDKDIEAAEFSKNSMDYQASLTFLNSKIRTMMSALKGE